MKVSPTSDERHGRLVVTGSGKGTTSNGSSFVKYMFVLFLLGKGYKEVAEMRVSVCSKGTSGCCKKPKETPIPKTAALMP